MSTTHRALSFALAFAWKSGVVVIAIALLAGLPVEQESLLSSGPSGTGAQVISRPEGVTTRVSMEVVPESLFSNCSLRNEEGKELLHAQYNRNGSLWISLGDAFPVRPYISVTRTGGIRLSVLDGDNSYKLSVRRPGPSGFVIATPLSGGDRGLGVKEGGELVDDPSFVEAK